MVDLHQQAPQVGRITLVLDCSDLQRAIGEALRELLPALDAFEPLSEEAGGKLARTLADGMVSKLRYGGDGTAGGAGKLVVVFDVGGVSELCASALKTLEADGLLVRRAAGVAGL
ncbi:hypothetical protein AQPW35_05940 [Rubrivivax pictus]|uniref:Uncharacterized protein n=2 Tax=Pseudaquabacterium pictum TaxID=2315236 RepID=A0A480AJ76_9BURK|nr:hypothetical protein AQPW35_05940 [Rubrivivax pictus]